MSRIRTPDQWTDDERALCERYTMLSDANRDDLSSWCEISAEAKRLHKKADAMHDRMRKREIEMNALHEQVMAIRDAEGVILWPPL